MSRTLSVDENNDIYIAADGNVATAMDLQATLQAAQQAAQTRLGEMVFAVDQGVPFFEAVWIGSPNLSQYDAALRSAILAVDGVLGVDDLTMTRAGDVLSYSATIQTIYGQGVINA